MPAAHGHKHTGSLSQNHKAQLANAYNELGKELSSSKIRVVGNYTLGKVIGEGAYGKVRLGTHRLTSTRVAIKQIPKGMSASLTREIHHHRQLHHPHITQMYEVIATESSIWIVTELCCGGELFDYLVEKGRIAEDEARVIFGQLCLAVAYLHDNGIVHRDLKLENVLLDERCRVKLGDFGFTREFDRGNYMETFCGTTGYAAPEMLQGKRYQGPEVDVWSLGIILYCLLTGTLPFDDDDEQLMQAKIIQGSFEDPVWLSLESRDLIKNILQKDVTKRLTIPQILAHSWFTTQRLTYEPDSPTPAIPEFLPQRSSTPDEVSRRTSESTAPDSSEASTQESLSPLMNPPDIISSTPTTPDESMADPFESSSNPLTEEGPSIHRHLSNSTIRKTPASDLESLSSRLSRAGDRQPATVLEEHQDLPSKHHSPSPLLWANGPPSAKAPPSHPVRTPARTKRRSVSSILSETGSPSIDKTLTPLPIPSPRDLDFASLLSTPTPIIFSTPTERKLLNTLSLLGFDTAQIVHSVLTDACDAAGAVWWMVRKKEDKHQLEDGDLSTIVASPVEIDFPSLDKKPRLVEDPPQPRPSSKKKKYKTSTGVQTDPLGSPQTVNAPLPAPKFALVPPTPTFVKPTTPPRNVSPTKTPMLSPSTSSITVEASSSRSNPSTPGGSMKDRDKDMGSKGRKPRAGSVSIMQRATTALEAAGLVRKKSSEAVREEKEREKERERERSRDMERRGASGDEPRSSYGSGSSKLTKSPPLKPSKDHALPPSTPPPNESTAHPHQAVQMGSPWVLADSRESFSQLSSATVATVNTKGEMLHSHSAPNFTEATPVAKPTAPPNLRNRANLLKAFRLWFNEDRRGKRKEEDASQANMASHAYSRPTSRRGSSSGSKVMRPGSHRAQRPSLSSRRSSSVNSRRSSGTSTQMMVMESPQMTGRKSFGSHTPNSERGDHSSRPSSIRSISMQPRHRKSPSQSSAGSIHLRTSSPMQKYHRRGGSGSSTRVVRQSVARPPHARSNSATSSIHSPSSSRPTSYYEPSESEGLPRSSSPFKTRSRRSTDDSGNVRRGPGVSTAFIAQKRTAPFTSPGYGGTVGRSSWKKSWGMEPPGWQSRTAHLPIEVLDISPAEPTSIRDVFSGKQANTMGDESDWVDEDDEIPAFAGGLGQLRTTGVSSYQSDPKPVPVTLSPAPRGHRGAAAAKRNARSTGSSSGSSSGNTIRPKPGLSPAERVSPLPADAAYDSSESRTARRQLPAARSGPAFRHAIQEEDEGEEE